MTNTFLVEIIKSLGEEGRQEAKLFLASPYHNRGIYVKEVQALFEIIVKAAPDFSASVLDRDRIYSVLFQDKQMVQGKLDKLMTELKKLLRQFVLTHESLSPENEDQHDIAWAAWLRKQNLEERFYLAMNKLKKRKRVESLEEHKNLLKIAEEEYEWECNHNHLYSDLGIPNLLHHLDLFYFVYRADLLNQILLQQKAVALPLWNTSKKEELYYEDNSLLLKVLKRVNVLLQKDTPEVVDFQGLADFLDNNRDNLPVEVIKRYSIYLRSFCTLLIDAGNVEFIPLLHQIHRNGLKDGFLIIDGKLENNAYLNIVQIAIRSKEIVWAKTFLEEYKGALHGGDEDLIFYRMNLSYCLFAEGNYEESLAQIPDAVAAPHYYLMTRRLELKIYYELNSELLSYKMDSFRKFIERTAPKSITANLRTMNLNFIYILTQLSQSPPKNKGRSERILKRIEEKKLICERSWLIEKAKNLK